jgi:hypothetical protein
MGSAMQGLRNSEELVWALFSILLATEGLAWLTCLSCPWTVLGLIGLQEDALAKEEGKILLIVFVCIGYFTDIIIY